MYQVQFAQIFGTIVLFTEIIILFGFINKNRDGDD